MKLIIIVFSFAFVFASCGEKKSSEESVKQEESVSPKMDMSVEDDRISLGLNEMQKQHQLQNMRSHLVAVQTIIGLLAKENYDLASKVAYTELGSTTEMKLMCASFGNKEFELMGLAFHESADKMSEIIKTKDKKASLEALSLTMNYCVQCHANYRQ